MISVSLHDILFRTATRHDVRCIAALYGVKSSWWHPTWLIRQRVLVKLNLITKKVEKQQ
jgi:hypothetical protein